MLATTGLDPMLWPSVLSTALVDAAIKFVAATSA
jgi:hypothetical protein